MTEPERLIEADTDSWLSGLLHEGLSESPSAAAYQRTLISVAGVGAVVAGSAKAAALTSHAVNSTQSLAATQTTAATQTSAVIQSAGGSATAGAGLHGASSAASVATAAHGSATAVAGASAGAAKVAGLTGAKIALPVLAKWVGIALVGSAGLVAGKSALNQVWSGPASSEVSAVSPTLNVKPASVTPKREASQQPADKARTLEPQSALEEVRRSAPVAVPARVDNATRAVVEPPQQAALAPEPEDPSAVAAAPDSELTLELSLLRAARQKLASGDANAALSDIAIYEQKCSKQQLRPEALLVRLEALERLGQHRGAVAVAREILAIDANVQHRQRAAHALSAAGVQE